MPVKLQNPRLFRPAVPRPPRLHGLFGSKNFQVHGFMEGDKWPPQALTDQYRQIVHMLETNVHYKKLEMKSSIRKKEEEFQDLKNQCRSGRMGLKKAIAGDQLAIRNLFSHNPTLSRLYSSMPLYAIVKHADDNTFCMRRERDRLRFELQSLMEIYKLKMIEKSKIEDRIKFDCEFRIPEENEIIKRKYDVSVSETRLYTLKAIQRAYKGMIQMLSKDELFFEPVLKSLEADVAEQQKFIQMTVMLGHPVITEKERQLREEYQNMEFKTKRKIKENSNLVDQFKKSTVRQNRIMIDTVRKSLAKSERLREYVRETESMTELRNSMSYFEKTMRELQWITTAGTPKDIYPKVLMTDLILRNEIKEKEYKDSLISIMNGTINPTISKKMETKFNFTSEEQTRLDKINELKEEVKYQKNIRKAEEYSIIKNGEFIIFIKIVLYQILDVLRHIEKPMPVIKRIYPKNVLQLPLLDFEAKPMIATPPDYLEENDDKVMARVLDKIKRLSKYVPASGFPSDTIEALIKDVRKKYEDLTDMESEEKGAVVVEEKKEEEGSRDFSSVLTRKQIKQQGRVIIEKVLEAKKLAGE